MKKDGDDEEEKVESKVVRDGVCSTWFGCEKQQQLKLDTVREENKKKKKVNLVIDAVYFTNNSFSDSIRPFIMLTTSCTRSHLQLGKAYTCVINFYNLWNEEKIFKHREGWRS